MEQGQFIILQKNEVSNLIEQSVKQALEKALPTIIRRSKLPKYIDTSTLCQLANWSPSKCQYLRDKKTIKFVQHGRSILYPTQWILDYLESHSVNPNAKVLRELEETDQ